LEIGVLHGYSMEMWLEFFPKATIYGMDIELPNHLKDKRLKLIKGDATKASDIDQIRSSYYDVIIDDGSHKPHDQCFAFSALSSRLKPGGFYFVEDIQDSEALTLWMKLPRSRCWALHKDDRHDDVLVMIRKQLEGE